MPTIYPGETRLIERILYQADGTTPLLVADLLSASVELRQGCEILETLVLGTDAELRQGGTTATLELELTAELTELLSPGAPLALRWKLAVDDADFTVEPDEAFRDFTEEEVFDVEA
jgi:hypothetical protein